MKHTMELFIEGTRADMFKDESVSITRKLKTGKDVGKLFTDFSKGLQLPASSKNNKLFKHIQRTDMVNGLDIRKYIDAEIKLNGVSYVKGFINVESINMADGALSSYDVQFTGELTLLKKSLKADKLSSLDLSQYDFDNGVTAINSLLSSTSVDFKAGLNSVNERIIAHSTDSDYAQTSGISTKDATVVNAIYSVATWSKGYGLPYQSVRPSISVKALITAIESKYGITFSGALKDDVLQELFLYCFRKDVQSEENNSVTEVMNFSASTDSDRVIFLTQNFAVNFPSGATNTEWTAAFTITSSDGSNFSAELKDGFGDAYTSGVVDSTSGSVSINFNRQASNFIEAGYAEVAITGKVGTTYSLTGTIDVEYIPFNNSTGQPSVGGVVSEVTNASATLSPSGRFYVKDNIPDIKVIDFLSGLFNMFNIVAYTGQGDGISTGSTAVNIVTKFHEDFIAEGTYWGDISQYVDIQNVKMRPSAEYSLLDMKFKKANTNLGKAFEDMAEREYGQLEYIPTDENGELLAQVPKKVVLPFESLIGERLIDIADQSNSVSYIHAVDKDFKQTKIAPYLHYFKSSQETTDIVLSRDNETNGGLNTVSVVSNHNVITPYNSNEDVMLSFNPSELDWADVVGRAGADLFFNYYETLIVDGFSEGRRKLSLKAYLPQQFHLLFNLNDTLKYQDEMYRVESMQTNHLTGDTKLELITA